MDLSLWDEQDHSAFGEYLRSERLRLPPSGWSQLDLASYVVEVLGQFATILELAEETAKLKEAHANLRSSAIKAQAEGRFPDKTFPILLPGALSAGALLMARSARRYILELESGAPELFGLLKIAHRSGSEFSPERLDEIRNRKDFKGFAAKWRSRIANLEAGRPSAREMVVLIVDTINGFQSLVARHENTAQDGPPTGQQKRPFLGTVPRSASPESLLYLVEHISAPGEWTEGIVDHVIRIGGKDFIPYFFPKELVGIKSANLVAPNVIALLLGPDGVLTLKVLRDEDGEIFVQDLGNQSREPWGDSWLLCGYAVGRVLLDTTGIRILNPR